MITSFWLPLTTRFWTRICPRACSSTLTKFSKWRIRKGSVHAGPTVPQSVTQHPQNFVNFWEKLRGRIMGGNRLVTSFCLNFLVLNGTFQGTLKSSFSLKLMVFLRRTFTPWCPGSFPRNSLCCLPHKPIHRPSLTALTEHCWIPKDILGSG